MFSSHTRSASKSSQECLFRGEAQPEVNVSDVGGAQRTNTDPSDICQNDDARLRTRAWRYSTSMDVHDADVGRMLDLDLEDRVLT